MKLGLIITLCLVIVRTVLAKKKKSSKAKKEPMFSSANLSCLVCKALVEEIEGAINKIDPAKKVEVGSHRINGDGGQTKKLVATFDG